MYTNLSFIAIGVLYMTYESLSWNYFTALLLTYTTHEQISYISAHATIRFSHAEKNKYSFNQQLKRKIKSFD